MSNPASTPIGIDGGGIDTGIDLAAVGSQLVRSELMSQLQKVASILKRRELGFPGSLPTTLSRSQLDQIHPDAYLLLAKTDGVRCLLYLTAEQATLGSTPAQFLISRRNEYYRVPSPPFEVQDTTDARAHSRAWRRGTLLDGEMARQFDNRGSPQLVFMAFDCLAMDGQDITQHDYASRRSVAQSHFFDHVELDNCRPGGGDPSSTFEVQMKETYEASQATFMWSEIVPSLGYEVDGLILVPKMSKYTTGTDHTVFKWKPMQNNTADFVLKCRPHFAAEEATAHKSGHESDCPIDLLVHIGSGRHEKYASLALSEQERKALNTVRTKLHGRVMECVYNHDQTWHPKITADGMPLFRDDKKHANYITVVENIQAISCQPIEQIELFGRLQNNVADCRA